MPRIGVLMQVAESDPVFQGWLLSFRDALVKLGREGRNLRVDFRWAGGDLSKLPAHAAELVALKPDAIFATTPASVMALQRATGTVPIMFAR
jgi:putative ABC transport system substrate-binding protein